MISPHKEASLIKDRQMTFDISRSADSESGKTFMPQSVVDQYTEDVKDEVYFDEGKLLAFVPESTNCGEFSLKVMQEFLGFMGNDLTEDEFMANVKEACQWFRNDMTDDLAARVVRNA
jgi:hypothetical protein